MGIDYPLHGRRRLRSVVAKLVALLDGITLPNYILIHLRGDFAKNG
jgi:hypothetical protein